MGVRRTWGGGGGGGVRRTNSSPGSRVVNVNYGTIWAKVGGSRATDTFSDIDRNRDRRDTERQRVRDKIGSLI